MKILLADDHVLFRDAMIQFIQALRSEWKITTSDDFNSAFELLENGETFDLVLLDLRMPGMNGLDGLNKIIQKYPNQMVAILSGVAEEHHIKRAMGIGAQAYFPKTLSGKALVKAIEYVNDSGKKFVPMADDGTKIMPAYFDDSGELQVTPPSNHVDERLKKQIEAKLTKREMETLEQLSKGSSNKEIADTLGIQIATVKLHVSGVCKKLDVENRTQAAILGNKIGL